METLRAHADGYILDEWRVASGIRLVDCGSGVGIPGLLIALELPDSRWTLVDSSERRCEHAQSAARAAGLDDRVVIEHARLEDLARREGARGGFDGAVARLFGPASELAECGLPLLKPEATLVVSVSAATLEDWRKLPLDSHTGCAIDAEWATAWGRYLAVQRFGPIPDSVPRRWPARRRAPF